MEGEQRREAHLEWTDRLKQAQGELNQIRGNFLAPMIALEDAIGVTIVHFFQPDEYPEFAEWVMPRIMFEKKLQILGKFLDFVGLRETYQADLTEMNPSSRGAQRIRSRPDALRRQVVHERAGQLPGTHEEAAWRDQAVG